MKKILTLVISLGLVGFLMITMVPSSEAQFSDTHHLLNAVDDNDIADARDRLFSGANPNARRGSDTALIMALRERYYEMMRLLLEHGALPNSKTLENEETAISLAATTGDETAFTLLLEYKANINIADRQGRTPLMKAASARKTRLVRMLLENGADIYATDYTGRDALDYAKDARARGVVKALEDAMAED